MSGRHSARYSMGHGQLNSGEIMGLPATVLEAMLVMGFDVFARSLLRTVRLRKVKKGLAWTLGWHQ